MSSTLSTCEAWITEEGRRDHCPGSGPGHGPVVYTEIPGHQLRWRHDAPGQAGLELPDSNSELVLTTEHTYESNWHVDSVDDAIDTFKRNGGTLLAEARDIPVGRAAVVGDPFGNPLVLLDLSKGTYTKDASGHVTGVRRPDSTDHP
jgi:hypothetical protein